MNASRRSSCLLAVLALSAVAPVARADEPSVPDDPNQPNETNLPGSPSEASVPPSVATTPAKAEEAAAPGIPLRLAVQVEAANGVLTGSFHNALVGARLDGRFSEHVSLGGYLGYANLKGKDGRAHAALGYVALEYMAGDPASTVRFPVRFGTGYLAANGPVARLSVGAAVAVGKKVDLIGEVASIVWITNNQNLVSLDGCLEVAFRF
jgi:hypothetical protein